MDCSQKVSVASISSEPSSTPKSSISCETDDNENVADLMDSPQNPQRTLHKHIMSPTISASDIPPPQKSLNLENGGMSCTSIWSVLVNYCSSESDRDEHHTTKSTNPYDPLTNYLSPRSKCLRCNQNRRRRIIGLHESKEEKKDDSRLPPVSHTASQKVVDSQTRRTDTVISPAQEGITQQENQEKLRGIIVELKVGIRKCSFKSVFKFMFLWTIIAISFSYMCSPKKNNVGLRLGNISVANYSSMNIIIQQQSKTNSTKSCLGNRQVECRGVVHSALKVEIEGAKMPDDPNNDNFDSNNELLKNSPGAKDLELKKLVSDQIESNEAPIPWQEVIYADNNDTSDETTEISIAEIPEIGSETFQDSDNFALEKNEPFDSEKIVANEESTCETEKAANFIDDVNELIEIQQKEEETVNTGITEDIGRNMDENETATSWSHKTTEGNETFHSTVMDSDNVASWSNETTKKNEHNGTFHSTVMDSDNIELDQLLKARLKLSEEITAAYKAVFIDVVNELLEIQQNEEETVNFQPT